MASAATNTVAAVEDRTLRVPLLALGRQLDDLVDVLIVMAPGNYVARPANPTVTHGDG
jgi:hypothetical protein